MALNGRCASGSSFVPHKKPVFIAFHAVSNLYKRQEEASDEPDSNPVYPVILSKNSIYIYCLPIQNDEESCCFGEVAERAKIGGIRPSVRKKGGLGSLFLGAILPVSSF